MREARETCRGPRVIYIEFSPDRITGAKGKSGENFHAHAKQSNISEAGRGYLFIGETPGTCREGHNMKLETLSENKIILAGRLAGQGWDLDLMEDITMCLNRFFAGDFGEIPEEDAQANRDNLENEAGRIIGRYNPGEDMEALLNPIYIMAYFSETEPGEDYSYTSVLYVSDYLNGRGRRRERTTGNRAFKAPAGNAGSKRRPGRPGNK